MDRIETYLAMGGYAAYVWAALAVAAVVMIGQVVLTLRTLRRREAALAELEAVRQRRRKAVSK
ncbi:MAG TPA: heme exporter protein CcmD [Verrucomicrobiae bacterium]|jgi:heme exporter protein D|nr:heme exporter protein CcmD [Verrucomicrobiae bacterium]